MSYYVPKKKEYLIEKIASILENSRGHFRNLILAILGALTPLAFPPMNSLLIPFVSFSLLMWALDGAKTSKRKFADGWWFGVGMFGIGLYWVSGALGISGYSWLALIAPLLIGIVLGLFTGFTTLLASIAPKGYRRILLFAAMWALLEWVRGWIFTGFPWNLMGSVWTFDDRILQSTSIIGAYGLSMFSVLLFCLPSLIKIKHPNKYADLSDADKTQIPRTEGHTLKSSAILSAIVLSIWSCIFYYGEFRLKNHTTKYVDGINLRLIQPNIRQTDKWNPEKYVENFNKYIDMTNSEGIEDITHIIWGETAATYPLDKDERIRQIMTGGLNDDAVLITGFPRHKKIDDKNFQAWNSMMAIDAKGKILSIYDKNHLVPFGEYIPFRNIVGDKINKITHGMKDFTAGKGNTTLNIKGLPPMGALICYEIIFPSHVTEKNNRPQLLVNITNDGWYGKTPGPYQHFATAKMRAVEEGIPVIRVANTGISGVIDAYGRIIGKTKLAKEAILDEKLPQSITTTIYGRFGNIIPLLLILLLTCIALIRKDENNL